MDKTKAVIVLLVFNLIAVVYFGNSLNKKISNVQTNVNSELNNMRNNVMSLESQIVNGVSRVLEAQDDRIDHVDYTVSEYDAVRKRASLALEVTLKEVSPESKISISYSAEGGPSGEAELVEQSGLKYGTELELSLEHNYEFEVWEQSPANGQRKMNVNQQRLPLYDDFYANRVSRSESGTSTSKDQLDADFSFAVKNLGIAETEMERVYVQVWYGNEPYDEIDVTQKVMESIGDYNQIRDKYNLAIASGSIDSSVSLEQFAKDNHLEKLKPGADPQYSFRHTIKFGKDYPELELDIAKAKQLSFRLVITFKDGYRYE
ncbi:hypothetical protein PAT3040_00151 [Paenibacillus agaridevorans]|uniref:Uncharacterized protein n=1 Tax=Paenibacillus agaridevorans TaxID=171404 RepID=A0A2R5EGM6_9BACL|nr:hypothetical protein [Paenibacillus agaridevorans]GBG05667.1 hypothetical protein PAT3040_00151 [Paenibacillus agaridevorans]